MDAKSDSAASPLPPTYLPPKVPEGCPVCGAPWKGGNSLPGNPLRTDHRVETGQGRTQYGIAFYGCGASLSCHAEGDNVFRLLLKNCWCEHNQRVDEQEENHP